MKYEVFTCSSQLLSDLCHYLLFINVLIVFKKFGITFFLFIFQGAIGCLASVTDSSVTKEVLVSLVKRFLFVDCEGEILTSPVGVVDSDQSDLKGYS